MATLFGEARRAYKLTGVDNKLTRKIAKEEGEELPVKYPKTAAFFDALFAGVFANDAEWQKFINDDMEKSNAAKRAKLAALTAKAA